ncbi:MAG: MoxR family ATPase [Desulfobacterales bacterium]|nr:MoxR family ATPase [Desulfobacterales bacterium]
MPGTGLSSGRTIYRKIADNIEKVMRGQSGAIRLALAGFAGGGHILLEDCPGTGKTTLAKTLARSMDITFKRIQFTPDLLPSDITGVSIFDPKEQVFRFHQGPIFTNILLVDEINRASPRTQSALLEAMAERQVSIDGQLHPLENPFFVIATQNPVESHGTYPLPEGQMDRFALQSRLGYVSTQEEVAILTAQSHGHPIEAIRPCATRQEVLSLRQQIDDVYISEELKHYIVTLVKATRAVPGVRLGASPRASLALMKTAKALCLIDGADFVTPDHIQELAVAVIAHRLALDPQARFAGRTARQVVEEIVHGTPVPT